MNRARRAGAAEAKANIEPAPMQAGVDGSSGNSDAVDLTRARKFCRDARQPCSNA
jgi:hypothetical protein